MSKNARKKAKKKLQRAKAREESLAISTDGCEEAAAMSASAYDSTGLEMDLTQLGEFGFRDIAVEVVLRYLYEEDIGDGGPSHLSSLLFT